MFNKLINTNKKLLNNNFIKKSNLSTLYSFGNGTRGVLGHPIINNTDLQNKYIETTPKIIENLNNIDDEIIQIACGNYHSACLTEKGDVYTWGTNRNGILGNTNIDIDNICETPQKLNNGYFTDKKIKQISLGSFHTALLTEDGELFTFGSSSYKEYAIFTKQGALGLGSDVSGDVLIPTKVYVGGSNDIRLKSISSGKKHMVGLGYDGEVWVWGNGENGVMGDTTIDSSSEPVPVEYLLDLDVNITHISCGDNHNLATSSNGELYVWGSNDQSQLGINESLSPDMYAFESYPRVLESLAEHDIVKAFGGRNHSIAITKKGEVFFFGYALWIEPHKMGSLEDKVIVDGACGDQFSAVLSDAGELFTWVKLFYK